ncbi:hypothetical protein FHR71_003960 [Methylobacterium sp. RAS18]|nr:hypothetical protein [Methylobacterium sp. RAS18]
MANRLLQTADLHFRTYLDTVMPLHESLVEEMCAQACSPLELATVLEDIGQRYIALAVKLNEALIRTGRLADEPDADDATDARLDEFVRGLIANAGVVTFRDGTSVKVSEALSTSPVVFGAIRASVLLSRSASDATVA